MDDNSRETSLQAGDQVELEIQNYDGQYRGRATVDGTSCLVMGASPGEVIKGSIIGFSRERAIVQPEEVLESVPARTEPRCDHFGVCAGCQFQHLEYERQLELKKKRLSNLMDEHGPEDNYCWQGIISSKEIYGYRNNITLHGPGEPGFWKVEGVEMLRIKDCPVCLQELREALRSQRGRGFEKLVARGVENILLRATSTGEVYVGPEQISDEENEWLTEKLPHPLREEDYELLVPSHGFWQGNTPTIPRLVEEVVDEVSDFGPARIVEGYAGMGLFSIFLCDLVDEITCIEINDLSVAAGRKNTRRLGLDNIHFRQGRTADELLDALWKVPSVHSTLIVDPPREGMPRDTLNAIKSHPPEQIVYVSCNPESLARNLDDLCGAVYEINTLRGLDLFPQTKHLELICDLRKI